MVYCVLCVFFVVGVFEYLVKEVLIDYVVDVKVLQCVVEVGMVLLCNVLNVLLLGKSVGVVVVIGSYVDVGVIIGGGFFVVKLCGGSLVIGIELIIWLGLKMYQCFLLMQVIGCCNGGKVVYVSGEDIVVVVKLVVQLKVVVVFVE